MIQHNVIEFNCRYLIKNLSDVAFWHKVSLFVQHICLCKNKIQKCMV